MKVQIELDIAPFTVPNFVRRKTSVSGEDETGIPLSDLDPTALSTLCDEFRREVFKKAGKQQPPQKG